MSVGPHYQLLAVDDDRGDLELLRMHLNAFIPAMRSSGSITIRWT